MSYDVKILADSVGPHDVRLTTLQITFPRFLLAELNTHRMLSRNSASSRAIPPEKIIEAVESNPFVPSFNKRVKGMGVGEDLNQRDAIEAREAWLDARTDAVYAARKLLAIDVDKSRINRLLEPFMWHTAICSATDWDNFYALRTHEAAQPEFRVIAKMMEDAMRNNEPTKVEHGGIHLPMVDPDEEMPGGGRYRALVGAGRIARVSFDTHEGYEDPVKSHDRATKLLSSGHWSPFEHVAYCLQDDDYHGNYRGFLQLRKLYPGEHDFSLLNVKEPEDDGRYGRGSLGGNE